MNLTLIKKIYFIGIGGIGMSALARYFNAQNKEVAGYDKVQTNLTASLIKEGINIHYQDGEIPDSIMNSDKETSLIVYTPAIPDTNHQLMYFRSHGFNIYKRSEVLGMITDNAYTIAIAGTHGKTTTTALLTHLLKSSGIECTAFLGGLSTNYNTNFLVAEEGNIIIVEADEYDRSFLELNPDITVITSIDRDHMDIYQDLDDLHKTFQDFTNNIKEKGILLINKHINIHFDRPEDGTILTYSADIKADVFASNLKFNSRGVQLFDARILDILPGEIHHKLFESIELKLPGKHNVENAVAAMSIAYYLGVNPDQLVKGLATFEGVQRRFDKHLDGEFVYIDDYAHHPKEIEVTLKAIQDLYPKKPITVIFQPHLFTRTLDFADEFGAALSIADELMLLDIYPAREKEIAGVNSEFLSKKVNSIKTSIETKQSVLRKLRKQKRDVLVTLGAGDIDELVNPIKEIYS